MPDARWPAAALATACLLTAASAATAESRSAHEVRRLAQRASSDPTALEELRRVREVDGRPVALARALGGSDRRSIDGRLRALAAEGDGPSPPVSAEAARHDAERILAGRKFNPTEPPRPFRGVLRRVGGWMRPVLGPVGDLSARLAAMAPVRLAAALGVVALAAVVSARLVRRRSRAVAGRRLSHRAPRQAEPAALERQADEAERTGDLDLAVRLRFRAGLLRLDRAGAVRYQPSLTTGQLRERLRSPALAQLAGDFDEIAYGGRRARPGDVETARLGWPRVLEEVGR